MQKKQTSSIIIGFLLVVILVALSFIGYLLYKKLSADDLDNSPIESHKDALSDDGAGDLSRYRALQLLGQRQDLALLEHVEKYRVSPQVVLRRVTAEAIGKYDDPRVKGWLDDFLKDTDLEVRLKAIQSLGRLEQPARVETLKEYSKRPDVTKKELIEISGSLIRIGSSQDKNLHIEKLVNLSLTETDSDLQSLSLMRLFSTVPADQRVANALQKIITRDQSPNLVRMSISHLAALRSPWLKNRLSKFSQHKESSVRLAALSSIHFACPKDRWEILKRSLSIETDPTLLKAALREPYFIGGPKAKDFLKKILDEQKFNNDIVAFAKKEIEKLSQEVNSQCP